MASEVKSLASETADSTSRIEQQVAAIRAATDAAVAAQRQAAAELSRTTSDAAGAVSGVTQDVNAIGEATVSTSTGATEMTGASLELSRLSADLRMHVAGFLEQIR